MLKVKIYDDYNLYRKHTFEFNEGLTCLIGKNGSGKSTLLKMINDYTNVGECYYYNNEIAEQSNKGKFVYDGDMTRLARSMAASEGQNIRYNFEDIISDIGNYVRKRAKKKEKIAIILIDGLDSGISLDYIIMLKKELL